MIAKEQIIWASNQIKPRLVKIRQDIHRQPELGFSEMKTAAYITRHLKELGLEVAEGVGVTGVTALLKGFTAGKTVAIRADMDALPLEEQTGLAFASENPGVMHACGHDAHIAMVLGSAMILTELAPSLKGQVKFIFQPCEEKPPGGALGMMAAGVLKNPPVDAIIGLHVNPYLPTGVFGYRAGPIMAATDMFTLTVKGKGGHGASPHQTVDSIVVSAQIIQALQTVASRQVDPLQPVVLSLGTIQGGYASNIIADRVVLTGTVRTLDENLRQEMPDRIKTLVENIARANGAECDLTYKFEYPVLCNNSAITEIVKEGARELLGSSKISELVNPSMGGEDFAFFAQEIPGCYFHLGVGKVGQETFPWHHPKFNLDEAALPIGAALLSNGALKILEKKGRNNSGPGGNSHLI